MATVPPTEYASGVRISKGTPSPFVGRPRFIELHFTNAYRTKIGFAQIIHHHHLIFIFMMMYRIMQPDRNSLKIDTLPRPGDYYFHFQLLAKTNLRGGGLVAATP